MSRRAAIPDSADAHAKDVAFDFADAALRSKRLAISGHTRGRAVVLALRSADRSPICGVGDSSSGVAAFISWLPRLCLETTVSERRQSNVVQNR
jgi:hypothetical protein